MSNLVSIAPLVTLSNGVCSLFDNVTVTSLAKRAETALSCVVSVKNSDVDPSQKSVENSAVDLFQQENNYFLIGQAIVATSVAILLGLKVYSYFQNKDIKNKDHEEKIISNIAIEKIPVIADGKPNCYLNRIIK